MTNKFLHDRYRVGATWVQASPNVVIRVIGNKAQLAYGQKKKAKKTENAYTSAVGFAPRTVREFEVGGSALSIGDKISVSIFKPGDLVKVTGTTKGRGFAGGVKRWGFHGGPKTHGQSDRHRAPGSLGQGTTPGRVFKGKKMGGHMGVDQLTVTGLTVLEVDETKNLLLIKGAIPGYRNALVIVEKTGKAKNFEKPQEEVIIVQEQEEEPKEQKVDSKAEIKEDNAGKAGDEKTEKTKGEKNA